MAAGRIILPCMPALDRNGRPVAGALLNFYENNTTTRKAVYTTVDLDVALPNPVVADAAGAFPSIFADSDELYSVTCFSPAGVMLPKASYVDVHANAGVATDSLYFEGGGYLSYVDGLLAPTLYNGAGKNALRIQHTHTPSVTAPRDALIINVDDDARGGSNLQVGGINVTNTVAAGADHNAYGIFSVLNNYSTSASVAQVGFYSQANRRLNSANPLWAGVFEVGDTNGGDSTQDGVLCGIEVDVKTSQAYTTGFRKIGVSMVAYGAGEASDGILFSAGDDPVAGVPGKFRYGLNYRAGSLNTTLGEAIWIQANHLKGLHIEGVTYTGGAAVSLEGSGPVGLNIGAGYTDAVVLPAGERIALNGTANVHGMKYNPSLGKVEIDSNGLAMPYVSLLPAAGAIAGYMELYIGATLYKIPVYAA